MTNFLLQGNSTALLKIWVEVLQVNNVEKKGHQLEAISFPAGQRSRTQLGCWQRRQKMSSIATIRIGKRTQTSNDVSGASRVIC